MKTMKYEITEEYAAAIVPILGNRIILSVELIMRAKIQYQINLIGMPIEARN